MNLIKIIILFGFLIKFSKSVNNLNYENLLQNVDPERLSPERNFKLI
jgi:hypothetical protein